MEQLVDGLKNAWAQASDPEMDAMYDANCDREPEAIWPYEKHVVDAATAEIAPTVAKLLEEAVAKRLPWTWEPER